MLLDGPGRLSLGHGCQRHRRTRRRGGGGQARDRGRPRDPTTVWTRRHRGNGRGANVVGPFGMAWFETPIWAEKILIEAYAEGAGPASSTDMGRSDDRRGRGHGAPAGGD